jgi:hypothetical protein
MQRLPERAHVVHLKKQAKDLLRLYRSGDPDAIARFARALPSAGNLSREELVSRAFRLHDAQSCIAREYGFPSWDDLTSYVDAQSLALGDRAARLRGWLALVYGGDVLPAACIRHDRVSPSESCSKPPILSWMTPMPRVRRGTRRRCGRRQRPIPNGSIAPAARSNSRRLSRSRIPG